MNSQLFPNIPSLDSLDGEELLSYLLVTFKGDFDDHSVSCAYVWRSSVSHYCTTGTINFRSTNQGRRELGDEQPPECRPTTA